MKKIDAIISIFIGLVNGLVFYTIIEVGGLKIPFSWLLPVIFPLLAFFGLLIASLLGRKFLLIFQFAKFFLVGTLNTFVDLAILNFLMWITGIERGIYYSFFKAISFLAATTNSYFWNKHWTFTKKEEIFAPIEYSKFLIVTLLGLLINVSVASFVVNVIKPQFCITARLWASVGAIIAAFFAFLWNFSASKFIVFKK